MASMICHTPERANKRITESHKRNNITNVRNRTIAKDEHQCYSERNSRTSTNIALQNREQNRLLIMNRPKRECQHQPPSRPFRCRHKRALCWASMVTSSVCTHLLWILIVIY